MAEQIGVFSNKFLGTFQARSVSEATLGQNLILNGDFATGDFTNWIAGVNWNVVANAAVRTPAVPTTLEQTINVIDGEAYQIDVTLGAGVAGQVQFSINGVIGRGYLDYANLSINTRDVIIANVTGAVVFAITPDVNYNGTLDNIQVRQVTRNTNPLLSLYDSAGILAAPVRASGTLGNIGFGYLTHSFITTGEENTAYGYNSFSSNVVGHTNVAFGHRSLTNCITGYRNVAIGKDALLSLTYGTNNTAIGGLSLRSLTTAFYNTCVGVNSGQAITTGEGNTAVGCNALYTNIIGTANVAIGFGSLQLTIGHYNTGVGYQALTGNNAGSHNTAVGYNAMALNTTADYGTAVGDKAAYSNQTGQYICAIGYNALQSTTGNYNTAVGGLAGYSLGAGAGCVFIGCCAGYFETGSNKLFIDNSTRTNEADARTKALIYGIFDALTANQYLTINGHLNILLSEVLVAANNAAASAAGVPVNGVYRTNADPSVLCIRSV